MGHAWSHLFQPALIWWNINQDWLFPGSISAKYSFDQAKLYIWNFSVFFFPALALNSSKTVSENWKWRAPAICLIFACFLNSILAFYQGVFDLNFLAEGGGRYYIAKRAIGFLEGGSAATIFFSSSVVGAASLILFGKLDGRVLYSTLAVFLLIAGANSSGRIFFFSIGISVGFLFLIKLYIEWKRSRLRKFLPYMAYFVLFLLILIVLAEWRLWRKAEIIDWLLGSLSRPDFNYIINKLDPVRANHWRTMFIAFIEHPIFGTGFGMFYANYFQYLPWALRFGEYVYPDPPASFYLMLLSEFGLAAVVIFYGLGRNLITLFLKGISAEKNRVWFIFGFGWMLSLIVSFSIGTHILYLSVSSVLALILGTILVGKIRTSEKICLGLFALFVLGGIGEAYFEAPTRPPLFNWKLRGTAQFPVTIKVPIAAPGRGFWFQSGSELLLESERLRFYIELPKQYYPIEGQIRLFGHKGQQEALGKFRISNYQMPHPGKTLIAEVPARFRRECLAAISPEKFCSFKIETNPKWDFYDYRVGFYLISDRRNN